MRVIVFTACALLAGAALADEGYTVDGEHYTDEELTQACEEVAEFATMLYTVRNMLPADLEQEKAMELLEGMVASGKLAEAAEGAPEDLPEEERQQAREMLSDPHFQEAFLMAAEYAWAHPHQDEYEMTEEERAQDLVEFHEDMVWSCEDEMKAAAR